MAYKELTNTGKNFIKTICSGTTDTLIKGNNDFALPFSENSTSSNIIYEANAIDYFGNLITNNIQLGESLIIWFNEYAKRYKIDANILAAICYGESEYKLWNYAQYKSSSGLAMFISRWIYDIILNDGGSFVGGFFSATEKNKLKINLTNSNNKNSYIYRGFGTTPSSIEIATNNRVQLHQNIMDNPSIIIKSLASLLKKLLTNNNEYLSSALLAFNCNILLMSNDYVNAVRLTSEKYGDNKLIHASDYIERIYRYLGDKNNILSRKKINKPKGISFGYNIDFEFDEFTSNLK